MGDNLTSIIITLITVVFGAGAWRFYVFLIKNRIETRKEKRNERTIFRDDLLARVDKLEKDKEECMSNLMNLNNQVAQLSVKLEFIERENDRLKFK
tara:strand:- start:101 stop:388 length:288 start_codon:yes stop_codon:yes gene_type:complete